MRFVKTMRRDKVRGAYAEGGAGASSGRRAGRAGRSRSAAPSGIFWRMRSKLPCLLAAAGLLSCATAREPWTEALPGRPEVLLEVLPPGAEVTQDGASRGTGSLTIKLGAAPSTVRVAAAGYEAQEAVLDPGKHAGARMSVVLRPTGYGQGRPIVADDGPALAAVSAWLLRAGRTDDALAYAERGVQAAPSAPQPRRALGLAYAKLGKRGRAAQELSQYLQLAPNAPDRAEIEELVERFRGDISIPARGY